MAPIAWCALAGLAVLLAAPDVWAVDVPCASDADCRADERCHGVDTCGEGVCAPDFTLSRFPLDTNGTDAYGTDLISVLDHSGDFFYTQCCDTNVTAYTGESVDRGPGALSCPAEPDFPACFFQVCTCGYADPQGEPFVINGHYVAGALLLYDGHAGYDYLLASGAPITAPRGGRLCKAQEDPINGHAGAPSAWDKFHTFYVDHGSFAGAGWSTWYLHGTDLEGLDLGGRPLRDLLPGECGEVAEGQVVARLGNVGTLLPHLHFEVRRYELGDGPESGSARIVDPYGWQGAGPDPLAANAQASVQNEPLWVGCGNGRRECGEACDDGNAVEDDGCSTSCELTPLLQCLEDLEQVRAELALCEADPPQMDADADGESDGTDRCPDTPAGAAVDDAGCSRGQFCADVPVRSWTGFLRCLASDWRNDDPLLRWPRDCRLGRGARGCVAASR